MEMTVHTMRAVMMFDCCHRISARAAAVALCLNPVSMVINRGLMVFTLEKRRRGWRNALIAVIARRFTQLVNKPVGKIRADSAQPPQVPASLILSANVHQYPSLFKCDEGDIVRWRESSGSVILT